MTEYKGFSKHDTASPWSRGYSKKEIDHFIELGDEKGLEALEQNAREQHAKNYHGKGEEDDNGTRAFFPSYCRKDVHSYPLIYEVLNQISNIWEGFLDLDEIPDQNAAEWKDYVQKAIRPFTTILLFWSNEASQSSSIAFEIEVGLSQEAYFVTFKLDDTPLPSILEEKPSLTQVVARHPVEVAEDMISIAVMVRGLFHSDLSRRLNVLMPTDSSTDPVRMRAGSASLRNYEITPSIVQGYGQFLLNMPTLSFEVSIPRNDDTLDLVEALIKSLQMHKEKPLLKKFLRWFQTIGSGDSREKSNKEESCEEVGRAKAMREHLVKEHWFGLFDELSDYSRAIKGASEHLIWWPKDSAVYNYRAVCHMEIGNIIEAGDDWERAIECAPYDYRPFKYRAIFSSKLRDFDSAIPDYTKALAILPNDIRLLQLRADAYHMNGEHAEALLDISKAIALNPNQKENYLFRARIDEWLDRHEDTQNDR